MKKPSLKRAEKLVRHANVSNPRMAGSEAALQNLLTQYEMILKLKQDTERLMQELLMKVPNASKLVMKVSMKAA